MYIRKALHLPRKPQDLLRDYCFVFLHDFSSQHFSYGCSVRILSKPLAYPQSSRFAFTRCSVQTSIETPRLNWLRVSEVLLGKLQIHPNPWEYIIHQSFHTHTHTHNSKLYSCSLAIGSARICCIRTDMVKLLTAFRNFPLRMWHNTKHGGQKFVLFPIRWKV
jgi:hypothetical protein